MHGKKRFFRAAAEGVGMDFGSIELACLCQQSNFPIPKWVTGIFGSWQLGDRLVRSHT